MNIWQHMIEAGLCNKDMLLFIRSSRAVQRYTHWLSSQTKTCISLTNTNELLVN